MKTGLPEHIATEKQKKEDSLIILNFIEQSQSKPLADEESRRQQRSTFVHEEEYQDRSNNILYASSQFLQDNGGSGFMNERKASSEASASDNHESRVQTVENIIDIPENEAVRVRGYIKRITPLSEKYKKMAGLEEFLGIDSSNKFSDEEQMICLLDKTGKLALEFTAESYWRAEDSDLENAIDPGILISYLDVTACGIYDSQKFKVFYLILPSLPPQKPYPYLSSLSAAPLAEPLISKPAGSYVAFLCGLNLKGVSNLTELRNLEHFLMTNKGESNIGRMLENTRRIIIAGDHIYEDEDMVMALQGGFKVPGLFSNVFENVASALSRFQDFLNLVSTKYLVDVMPGEKDASSESYFPQRNSEACFSDFFECFQKDRVRYVSNPYLFEEKSVSVLISSGQNIKNLLKYSPFEHKTECELMEWSLYWRNISPISCKQAIGFEECLTLEELPHVYIMGNAKFYDEKLLLEERSSKVVKLLCAPDFCSLPRIYFVALDSLEVLKVVLNSEIDDCLL